MQKKDIWNRSFIAALQIIRLTKEFPQTQEAKIIVRQIIRSATSVGANISEASAGLSKKEFTSFMNIARREAIETDYWLRLSYELSLANREKIVVIGRAYQEIIKIVSTIVKNSLQKPKE